jgi:hypothetical protein
LRKCSRVSVGKFVVRLAVVAAEIFAEVERERRILRQVPFRIVRLRLCLLPSPSLLLARRCAWRR